jgi:hypothetical protein
VLPKPDNLKSYRHVICRNPEIEVWKCGKAKRHNDFSHFAIVEQAVSAPHFENARNLCSAAINHTSTLQTPENR